MGHCAENYYGYTRGIRKLPNEAQHRKPTVPKSLKAGGFNLYKGNAYVMFCRPHFHLGPDYIYG